MCRCTRVGCYVSSCVDTCTVWVSEFACLCVWLTRSPRASVKCGSTVQIISPACFNWVTCWERNLWCFTTSLCWGITKSGIDLVHVFQNLLMMKWFPFPKILGDACILAEAADPDEPAQREPGDACGKLHWLHGGEGTPQTPLFSILPCSLIPRNCTKNWNGPGSTSV